MTVVETPEPDSSCLKLTVTVPPQSVRDIWQRAAYSLAKEAKIPGLKPGAAVPELLLYMQFQGGEKYVKQKMLQALLQRVFPEALASVAERALTDSEHVSTPPDQMLAAIGPQVAEPFVFEITVDVAPELKWRADRAYKGLQVSVEVDPEGPEEKAAAELRSRHKDTGALVLSKAEALREGDLAILDMSACRVTESGAAGDRILSAEQKGFELDTGEPGALIPGLVAALLGMRREKTREFDLTFPPTWGTPALRNVKARFTVTLQEMFLRELPELSDELAPKLIKGAESLDQVRSLLLEKHTALAEKEKRTALNEALIDALCEVSSVVVPNSLLEEQGRQTYGAKLIEMQAASKLTMEQVAALSSQEAVEQFLRKEKRSISRQVQQSLACAEIFRAENLTVSEEEIDRESIVAEEEFRTYNQEYDPSKVREQASQLLEGAKVLQWLTDNSEITYVPKAALGA